MKIGLDIGSTTIKCILIDNSKNILYKAYERHLSKIPEKTVSILSKLRDDFNLSDNIEIAVSGSSAMGLSEFCGIQFVQEVYAEKIAVNELIPNADCVIELGGEDAKILFLSGCLEVRMNGTCAGGTGAFIDQMSTLMDISPKELNIMASSASRVYPIASRCGVFAKSDIQPLLNQGASKNDISLSILEAVKNQTISGLAQSRKIEGNVVYLGGPLTFLSELRNVFDKSLSLNGVCPENSLYYVAIGASLCCNTTSSIENIIAMCKTYSQNTHYNHYLPLFKDNQEYEKFRERHSVNSIQFLNPKNCNDDIFIGIDAGSTTIKAVAINSSFKILYSEYLTNSGEPLQVVKQFLNSLYMKYPNIKIVSSSVTGYGEDIIKTAFNIDFGIVETTAHFLAAKHFMPDVEFIIDIGGQDIKCFKIDNGAISNIFLNEACSSGCGSFLQSFSNALGYSSSDFAKLAILSKAPADLGSRCTVFMNSSVKQAQKDGASIEDISAGLAISVVKNALYKVIRASDTSQLGKKIVVQGGTFLNDAVLRAFENEIGLEVIRPNIAGLMGAYGAAIYSMDNKGSGKSSILNQSALNSFSQDIKSCVCGICGNKCKLSINKFSNGKKYITGNRCEKPTVRKQVNHNLNIYEYKLKILSEYFSYEGKKETIGIPMVLNMFELLPFWYKFFSTLGFGIKASGFSGKDTYSIGQTTLPSDTICFPAKLVHGHIQSLIDAGCSKIFYPCMSYNFNEHQGSNHYNCPVVAYYPEVISSNMTFPNNIQFIGEYVGIHKRYSFPFKMQKILSKYFGYIPIYKVIQASNSAFQEYKIYRKKLAIKSNQIIEEARKKNINIVILAGRPYHTDSEINHRIDKLIEGLGAAIISEDSILQVKRKISTNVLNQWTYHSRLYNAAEYASSYDDINLVHLVSFGCGIDAITSDEIRRILEKNKKIYTQIKIDETTNPGAVKIRLRSLFETIQKRKGK